MRRRGRTVLIVCGPGDEHALSIALRLAELDLRPVPVDLAKLPESGVAVRLGAGRPPRVLLGANGEMLDPASCIAGWWRRPRPVEAASPSTARLTDAEWSAALAGIVRVVGGAWVNDPGAEEIARRKLVQLEAARRCGLRVPATLVTNDLERARRFVARCRRGAVLKSLSSVVEGGFTRPVQSDDGWLADRLRAGPAILQERVDGLDLRVTIVGEAVFAMSLDARASGNPVDVREDWERVSASARAARLPDDLVRRLLALQRRLGLRFGAVDLRRRPRGGYTFLEVNPSGQWLHAEAATGHPIGATLARLLVSVGSGVRIRERDGAPPAARAVRSPPRPAKPPSRSSAALRQEVP